MSKLEIFEVQIEANTFPHLVIFFSYEDQDNYCEVFLIPPSSKADVKPFESQAFSAVIKDEKRLLKMIALEKARRMVFDLKIASNAREPNGVEFEELDPDLLRARLSLGIYPGFWKAKLMTRAYDLMDKYRRFQIAEHGEVN